MLDKYWEFWVFVGALILFTPVAELLWSKHQDSSVKRPLHCHLLERSQRGVRSKNGGCPQQKKGVRYLAWIAIILSLFLLVGIIVALASKSLEYYRLHIISFIAISVVFVTTSIVDNIGFGHSYSYPHERTQSAGLIFVDIVYLLWIIAFGAEEGSAVYTWRHRIREAGEEFHKVEQGGMEPTSKPEGLSKQAFDFTLPTLNFSHITFDFTLPTLNFSHITSDLFLLSTILFVELGLVVAFAAAFGEGVSNLIWIVIISSPFLLSGIIVAVASESLQYYRLPIISFIAISVVLATTKIVDISSVFFYYPHRRTLGAGLILVDIVYLLWILAFSAEEGSAVYTWRHRMREASEESHKVEQGGMEPTSKLEGVNKLAFDFTMPTLNYSRLFLFSTINFFAIGWVIAFVGALNARYVSFLTWIVFLYSLILLVGIIVALVSKSFEYYRLPIITFIAISVAFVTVSMHDIENEFHFSLTTVGLILMDIVSTLWILAFGAEKGSAVYTWIQRICKVGENSHKVEQGGMEPNASYAEKQVLLYNQNPEIDLSLEISYV